MPETLIAGRYRLEELLGRTGMSEVWAATDTELDRRVALKLLGPDADTARFEREARAFAALAHPNVTQLYDYGEDQGRPYMVLEYVPGGTLEDRLQRGPLPDDQAWAIAADIAAGLAHAHARGVVHRDLKPLNVLFDEEGRAKIADFGIARMSAGEGTLTDAGTVLGTAAYISPEQAHGLEATPASDVYSFGVILFRMLTGRPPFVAGDPLELVVLHRDAEAPPIASYRPDAPPVLEALATASLAKDPRLRPQDGAALLAALGAGESSALATDEATRVLPPPPPPPRDSRRVSALALAALVVLALAGAALAYALTRPTSKPALPPSTTSGSLSLPTTTAPTTSTTTASTSTAASTSVPTTTAPPTTVHTTTVHTTTAPPPPQTTTTAPPPPPPTTTAAPPPTTTAATTT